MLDFTQLEVDVKARETYWPLDPDIDLAASDVSEWLKTGDGLVPVPKGHPSRIRWRPLTRTEQGQIFSELNAGKIDHYGMLLRCAGFGLLSVEGMTLGTDPCATGRAIKPLDLAKLELLRGDVPGLGMVSPLAWIGGLIADASFRTGG